MMPFAMSAYLVRHGVLGLLVVCALAVSPVLAVPNAWAESPTLTAPDIHRQVENGEMILLDIRTPQEWQETGLAAGAWPVSMHEEGFGRRLQNLLKTYRPTQIALICATGGRTAHVISILKQNGIEGVADVSEGMMGNPRGPGWIERDLPVVPLEEATAVYEAAKSDW